MSISSPAEQSLNLISKTVFDNQLYILPLYSIRDGGACSCGKADCGAPGKHPLFRYNWKIIASNKPEKVTEWLSAHNKMNFGLATGRLSKVTGKYLIVIDVDAATHPFIDTLPNTFSYRTGSGGHHFWFWSKYPIKNSVSLLADKVDVRGTDGYVVIPPSKHRKGTYNSINNAPISDLPQTVLNALLTPLKSTVGTSLGKVRAKGASNKQRGPSSSSNSIWITKPVAEIRETMKTVLIPSGVRNVVMHRLLSSDRAKGALKTNLTANARGYLKQFEQPETFRDDIPTIIASVMKYPAYNNCHDKVNELYVSWLKNNRNIKLSTKEAKSLVTEDNRFFDLLQPTDIKQHRVTLQQILDNRIDWLKAQGQQHISNYKTQLLAKKLTELGFRRTRTAKGNWWNVFLPAIVKISENTI